VIACVSVLHLAPSAKHWEVVAVALEVNLGRLWEQKYKEKLVSGVPTRMVHLWGRFLKL